MSFAARASPHSYPGTLAQISGAVPPFNATVPNTTVPNATVFNTIIFDTAIYNTILFNAAIFDATIVIIQISSAVKQTPRKFPNRVKDGRLAVAV